ncbi:alpha/beta hydrolase family protein [Leifsonia flava]|uniref:Acetylesterase n=1 Tax=Orlajensenia leifsoniae TaxID=2561933 RepID=A0A4Y9R0K2_9MICO|nr:dienelactone hydrolase family protein [Leifsonia flava]TFV96886.1 acetylesterase [Leifsonia flava]
MSGVLDGYEDWPAYVADARAERSTGESRLAAALGLVRPSAPPEVRIVGRFERDGLEYTELRWDSSFGPEATGWLVAPVAAEGAEASAIASERLPGVLALHAHGGQKVVGAEQLLDLGAASVDPEGSRAFRAQYHEGLAPAGELARRGFAVLVHDAFLWGSRRFAADRPRAASGTESAADSSAESAAADRRSVQVEHRVAKAAGLLGTSIAGTVLHDDLQALAVLAASDRVDSTRLGVFGFSGGGARAHLLAAEAPEVSAVVVSCMMTTFTALVPDRIDQHSWLLLTPGLSTVTDWPDIAGAVDGQRMLTQYCLQDHLFDVAGMRAAHAMLTERMPLYTGSFHQKGHVFDAAMQHEAWRFLEGGLRE